MVVSHTEYLIGFDAEKCTHCHGCEVACKTWRELEYGIRYRRMLSLWQGEYPHIKQVALSLACLHCVEPACMAACPEEAISKRIEDGLVMVDETHCSGCGNCAEVCVFGAPQFRADGIMQKCDLCRDQPLAQASPHCVVTCPGGALSLTEVSRTEKKNYEEIMAGLLTAGYTDRETAFE